MTSTAQIHNTLGIPVLLPTIDSEYAVPEVSSLTPGWDVCGGSLHPYALAELANAAIFHSDGDLRILNVRNDGIEVRIEGKNFLITLSSQAHQNAAKAMHGDRGLLYVFELMHLVYADCGTNWMCVPGALVCTCDVRRAWYQLIRYAKAFGAWQAQQSIAK